MNYGKASHRSDFPQPHGTATTEPAQESPPAATVEALAESAGSGGDVSASGSTPPRSPRPRRWRRRASVLITLVCALFTLSGSPSAVDREAPPQTWDLHRTDRSLVFVESFRGVWSIACVTVSDDLLEVAAPTRVRYLRQRAIVSDSYDVGRFTTTQDESMTAVSVGVTGLPRIAYWLYWLAAAWTIVQFLLIAEREGPRLVAYVASGEFRSLLRRRPPRGFCGQCSYNLTGNVSGVCPECGTTILPEWR